MYIRGVNAPFLQNTPLDLKRPPRKTVVPLFQPLKFNIPKRLKIVPPRVFLYSLSAAHYMPRCPWFIYHYGILFPLSKIGNEVHSTTVFVQMSRFCAQWRRLHGARGHHELKNNKQETDQTVLTITKALTKTTNCTFRAKKWRGTTKFFFGVLRRIGAPSPTFKFVPSPPFCAPESLRPRFPGTPTREKAKSRLLRYRLVQQWDGMR